MHTGQWAIMARANLKEFDEERLQAVLIQFSWLLSSPTRYIKEAFPYFSLFWITGSLKVPYCWQQPKKQSVDLCILGYGVFPWDRNHTMRYSMVYVTQ